MWDYVLFYVRQYTLPASMNATWKVKIYKLTDFKIVWPCPVLIGDKGLINTELWESILARTIAFRLLITRGSTKFNLLWTPLFSKNLHYDTSRRIKRFPNRIWSGILFIMIWYLTGDYVLGNVQCYTCRDAESNEDCTKVTAPCPSYTHVSFLIIDESSFKSEFCAVNHLISWVHL